MFNLQWYMSWESRSCKHHEPHWVSIICYDRLSRKSMKSWRRKMSRDSNGQCFPGKDNKILQTKWLRDNSVLIALSERRKVTQLITNTYRIISTIIKKWRQEMLCAMNVIVNININVNANKQSDAQQMNIWHANLKLIFFSTLVPDFQCKWWYLDGTDFGGTRKRGEFKLIRIW